MRWLDGLQRLGCLHLSDLHSGAAKAINVAAPSADARAALQQVFAVQGWAPRARTAAVRQFAKDYKLALTIHAPGAQDTPPTLLDNPGALRGGEGLVTF